MVLKKRERTASCAADVGVLQVVTCALRVYKTNADKSVDDVVRCFVFEVPPETVAAYFYVIPPPTKIPPARASSPLTALLLAASEPEPETVTVTSAAPSPSTALLVEATKPEPETVMMLPSAPAPSRRDPRDIAETVNRLTKSTRPPAVGNITVLSSVALRSLRSGRVILKVLKKIFGVIGAVFVYFHQPRLTRLLLGHISIFLYL